MTAVRKLGVIAGAGSLPAALLAACDSQGIETFVVAFAQTDPALYAGRPHLRTRLGAAGKMFRTLRREKISDIVWIGGLRRPSLIELRPDWLTLKFFASLGTRALGDDRLLKAVRKAAEAQGFQLHGIQEFAKELLGQAGPLGRLTPDEADRADISRGIMASQILGTLDIGQAAVVQEGLILGVEAVEGTDELLHRCAALKRAGRGPILVKTCKPGQDRMSDLPTLGPNTVRLCADLGYRGIVYQAGATLLADAQAMADLADQNGIFVIGENVISP